MGELTRRRLLTGAAASLPALAGCSSLPLVGERDPELGFDPSALSRSVAEDLPDPPATYPVAVPEALATHHRQRARELLEGVPEQPGFANEGLASQIAEMRTEAAADIQRGSDEARPLERLADWRSIRDGAAEVRAAYDAAAGDLDPAAIAQRRDRLRGDLAAFERAWESAGRDRLDALAAAYHLEDLQAACRRWIDPDDPTPTSPRTNALALGRQVSALERARAILDDLAGLREAHHDAAATLRSHQDTLAIMADRVDRLVFATDEQVDLYLREDAGADDFERRIDGLPAEQVFYDVQRWTQGRISDFRDARTRNNHARTVVRGGHALVTILALSGVVDAIQADEYGMPNSVDEVREYRDRAVSAFEAARSVEPTTLAALLSLPAWNRLRLEAENFRVSRERGPPDERDVVRLVAAFVAARHFANAVQPVARRLRADLGGIATG